MWFITVCFFLLLGTSIQFPDNLFYNVAVVEFGPNLNISLPPNELLNFNTEQYLKIINEIYLNNNKTVDLIVFPENTLMYSKNDALIATVIPPLYDVILCNSADENYSDFLKEISCAAITAECKIVINFVEKVLCDNRTETIDQNCKNKKQVFYNTNVAFEKNGTIIARYRKWNLFGEFEKSKPETLDVSVFSIRDAIFGMMTCFDIQFALPAKDLIDREGARHIIFPLEWISELPYLTALQVQQMWAQEHQVVLLAAGSSVPSTGAGGSGIFLGEKGPMAFVMLPVSGTKVIFQKVPMKLDLLVDSQISSQLTNNDEEIDKIAAKLDDFYMLIDTTMEEHNFSKLIIDSNASFIETVCHGNETDRLCCQFNISTSFDQDLLTNGNGKDMYSYFLVAYSGIRSYSKLFYGGVQTCGVVACLNGYLNSCGQRFSNYSNIIWPITFTSINITADYLESDQKIQYPSTLLSSIQPIATDQISWTKKISNDSHITRELMLKESQNRLLTFGIFGRDFSEDWFPPRKNSLEL